MAEHVWIGGHAVEGPDWSCVCGVICNALRPCLSHGRCKRPARGIECESCMDCRQPYTVWYADNDLWNAVMGPNGPGMLCARCFLIRAEPASEICRITWAETPSRRDRERPDYLGSRQAKQPNSV